MLTNVPPPCDGSRIFSLFCGMRGAYRCQTSVFNELCSKRLLKHDDPTSPPNVRDFQLFALHTAHIRKLGLITLFYCFAVPI